jgi:hypothetical protein
MVLTWGLLSNSCYPARNKFFFFVIAIRSLVTAGYARLHAAKLNAYLVSAHLCEHTHRGPRFWHPQTRNEARNARPL